MTPISSQRLKLAILLPTLVPLWPIVPALMILAMRGDFDPWIIKGPVIARGRVESTKKIRFEPEYRMNTAGARVIALPHVNEIERKYHKFWLRNR